MRNSGFLAELTYPLTERIALIVVCLPLPRQLNNRFQLLLTLIRIS